LSKEKESWYDNQEEWNKVDIETNVVLRLSNLFDIAAEVISEKLGYKSLSEYVSDLVKQNVRAQMDGAMDLKEKDIAEVEKLIVLIDRQRYLQGG
jgi:hypothetical protein